MKRYKPALNYRQRQEQAQEDRITARMRAEHKRKQAAKRDQERQEREQARLTARKIRKYGRSYRSRQIVLRNLGFRNMQAYLDSDLWAAVRARVLIRDNGRCRLCHMFAAECVHHLAYDLPTMQGDSLDRMLALCHPCHYRREFKRRQKRKRLAHVRQATVARLKRAEQT